MSNIQVSSDKARKEIESVGITDNIRLCEEENCVVIIDQTKIPNSLEYKKICDLESAYQAIKKLEVRGAPAIGIFAGYAMYVLSKQDEELSKEDFFDRFQHNREYLNSSRPTAVNLSWALKRMNNVLEENAEKPVKEIIEKLKEEAISIHEEDIEMCLKICEYGLSLLKDGDGVLTHCNA